MVTPSLVLMWSATHRHHRQADDAEHTLELWRRGGKRAFEGDGDGDGGGGGGGGG